MRLGTSLRWAARWAARGAAWAFLAVWAVKSEGASSGRASRGLCGVPSRERLTAPRLCACAGGLRRVSRGSAPPSGLHLWKDFLSPEEGEELREYLDEGQPPWKKEQFGVPTLYKAGLSPKCNLCGR